MTSQHPSLPPPSQQSQYHPPPWSSSHRATTPPPFAPCPSNNTNPNGVILQGPECYGPLHNLHWQFRLEEDGSHYLVSSAYKPLKGHGHGPSASTSRDVSTSPAIANRKKAAKGKSKERGEEPTDEDAGTWQVRAARFREDGSGVEWYSAEWCGGGDIQEGEERERVTRIKELLVKSKSPNWAALESRIQAAFHARDITVAVHRRDVKKDGTWSQMQLILGQDTQSESTDQQQTQTQSQWQASAAAAASSSSSAAPTTSPPIHLSLRRVSDEGSPSHALLLVSYLCADLMRSNTLLESSLTLKQSKLQHARRLAGIAPGSGGPREMAYAASLGLGPGGGSQSVSLVNPGRIKRKRVDDEGFEEDSEEEKASIKGDAAVAGSPSDGKRPEGGSQTEEE